MSNRIRIKRRLKGSTETTLPDLYTGELAYDEIKGKLYIGESDNGTTNAKEIGGSGWLIPSVTGISPLRDGTGSYGTWNIDISGNARTVTSGVYRDFTLTAGSGLQGGGNFTINRTINIGQGDGILVTDNHIAVDSSVIRTTGNQNLDGIKTFNSGILVSTTGLSNDDGFTFVGSSGNGIYVPSGTIRTQNLRVDGWLTIGTKLDILAAAEILSRGPVVYKADKFIFESGVGIFTSGLFVGPTGSPTGVSLSGHKHVWSDITDFCSGVNSCVDTPLVGGSGLVLNYSDPNLSIDIGQGDGISVSSDAVSVNNTVLRTTGNQTIAGAKTFNDGSITTVGIVANPNGTGSLVFGDGSQLAYLRWDGQNNKLIFDSTLNNAELTINKTLNYKVPSTGNSAVIIPVFTGGDPTTSAQAIAGRGLVDFKTDLQLNNLTNDAQIKKLNSSTQGYVPVWSGSNGDQLSYGYDISTDLTTNNSSSYLVRADAAKSYIDSVAAANNAMIFKGTLGTGGTIESLPTTHSIGWAYRIITAGTYAGKVCEIGDLIIAVESRSGSGNLDSDWTVAQGNTDGTVVGPASSTLNNFVLFSDTTGKVIKDAGFGTGIFALSSRTITPGSGLFGDSAIALTSDITLNIGQGDGISVGSNIISLNSTVVRTSGAQTINGDKTFSDHIAFTGSKVSIGKDFTRSYDLDIYSEGLSPFRAYDSNNNYIQIGPPEEGTNVVRINSYDRIYLTTSNGDVRISGTLTINGQSLSSAALGSASNGQLLIGNGSSFTKSTLTAGTGISISNGSGSITISASLSGYYASGIILANQTANTIASFDSNKNVVSLSTGTYPSLSELSYVKGVTSSIQNQLNVRVSGTGTGSSTAGYIPRWISSSGVANSTIYQSGNNVGIGITNPSYNLQLAGDLKASTLYGDEVYIANSIFSATEEGFVTINSNSVWVVDTEMGSFNFANLIIANNGTSSVTLNGITNTTIDCGTF